MRFWTRLAWRSNGWFEIEIGEIKPSFENLRPGSAQLFPVLNLAKGAI
jgi:hypothetical protein